MTCMSKVSPRLARFVSRMESKLARPENLEKSDWREQPASFLLGCLLHEVGELSEALGERHNTGDVVDECADVANFAMMIADRAQSGPEGT